MEEFKSLEVDPNCRIDGRAAHAVFAQEFSGHKVLRVEEDGVNAGLYSEFVSNYSQSKNQIQLTKDTNNANTMWRAALTRQWGIH